MRKDALQILSSAIEAVKPQQLMAHHLKVEDDILKISGESIPISTLNSIYVIGAGKASAAMALETEKIVGHLITSGIVTTRYGHALRTEKIKVIEAGHPIPDERGEAAVHETLSLLEKTTANDLVICLISGGASALWCDPVPGISAAELSRLSSRLIASSAAIHEINTVRKHLSVLKAGQLIRYCHGARIFSLIISDVPGDDLQIIASGPTSPDASTFQDTYDILQHYYLWDDVSFSIQSHINNGIKGIVPETPKPGDTLFARTINCIIGKNVNAILAATRKATALGYHCITINEVITGDTLEAAKNLLDRSIQHVNKKPCCIIQGGETTLNVTGSGKGGRNQHFALQSLYLLSTPEYQHLLEHITILSAGTDGSDGPTDAAGAMINNQTMKISIEKKLSIEKYLENFDAYHFFEQTGSLIKTGPTQTNVMDIMIAIIS